MKKILITFLLLLSTNSVIAEQFICFDAQDNFLHKTSGDCLTLGICSGFNNTGLNPDCIIATQEEYDIASRFTEFDGNVVVGSRVVAMQQSEIDAINASDALASKLALRQGEKAQYDIIHLRALIEIILSEINILRVNDGLSQRTLIQLRNALEAKVDELTP